MTPLSPSDTISGVARARGAQAAWKANMIGWYVANKGTNIVVSGPFESRQHAERDRAIIESTGGRFKLVQLRATPE